MKISSDQIIENTFLDFSIEGSSIVVNNSNYSNIYTIIIRFYNNSFLINGFDFYERNVFSICKNTLSHIELIKLKPKCYELSIQ